MSGKLESSGKFESSGKIDDELCDNCKTLDLKKVNKANEKSLDATLSKMTIDDTKKYKDDLRKKAEEDRKKRREIDSFNSSSKSPKKDVPDSYGSIFANRKDEIIDMEKRKKYKEELVAQMKDKKSQEEIEKEKQKKKELDEVKRQKEEILKKNKMEADLKAKKNKEHQEFIKKQMNAPASNSYKATLGTSDQVFMSRLLSTAERKKRQLEEARERKRTQLDIISDKRERMELIKKEESERSEKERKENEAKIKKEQKEALEKKRKQQEENKASLQKQIEDKKVREKEKHIDSIPFIFGTESQRIAAIKKHASKCQRCGRLIEEFGTTKFLNMGRRASNAF